MRKIIKAGIVGAVVLSSTWVIGSNWKDPAPLPEITVQLDPAKAARADGLARTDDGRLLVLVELTEPSAALVYAKVTEGKSIQSQSVRIAAAAATRSSVQRIEAQQRSMAVQMSKLGAREVYRVSRVMNGIAVAVAPEDLDKLRALSGVRRVLPIPRETPSVSNSMPFLGLPNVWGNTLGLPSALTGQGIRIGIIDTGIDYLHADFGGTGALADYQADNTALPDPHFPSAKVAGGIDLAGDTYTGSNSPTPDANPMDCNGHGTHVAGTAAGYGVTTAGTTYNGAYGMGTPFASLSIAPGAAPQASLYAIRVFGCTGSTGLTVQGIDWAMDPNGDSDLSDHLDVINMSLGSTYGSSDDATSVASDAAAAAGVVVVVSAGNSGDTYFISGSPGASKRALTVAAVADSGIDGVTLQINSPGAIAGAYPAVAAAFTPTPPPAPAGQTGNIVAALDPADVAGPSTTDGCSALTNAAAVAGNIALIDRGTCGFTLKAQNAQTAGAIGVIIANNVPGDPTLTTPGGAATPSVTIPTIFVSKATGDAIRAQLGSGPVNATFAAANAGDMLASFSSRGPSRGDGASRLKPDIAAPGVNIISAQTGKTCISGSCMTPNASGFIPNNQPLTLSGTSMAAPHMTGIMALLKQEHPTWSVEQLKALAMNGALHDVSLGAGGAPPLISGGRVGAGRTDPSASAVSPVIALNADDSNLVSVSFRSYEVVGSASEVRKVRLANMGNTAQTYNLSIANLVVAPGVTFSLPGGSTVTIPANGSVLIDVRLDATAALMTHAREASVAPTQAAPSPLTGLGNVARAWLTDASSNLVLSQGGNAKLRLPLYVASRPASAMSAPATITTGGASTGSTTIPLSGTHVCTGTLAAGPTCTGTFPNDEVSLVTPFELQVVHARDTTLPGYANIQYAGVAYNAASNVFMFGVSSWGDWATPTDVTYNIYIDYNNDGTWDRILFNSNPGTIAGRLFGTANVNGQDSFITGVYNLATSGVATQQFVNRISAASVDSVLFKNNVMFLAATPTSLNITPGTPFRYKIQTCPGQYPLCGPISSFHYDEAAGPYVFNSAAQGLDFSGTSLASDLNGASLPVTWNTANMTTNGSLGALLLHHHNRSGERAEVVAMDTPNSNADLAVTESVSPPTPAFGTNATFTVTLKNNGPATATGIVVTDLLPAGLTFAGAVNVGTYNSVTGAWNVPSLASGATATLSLSATVNTTDQACNTAQITSSTPLDPNPANNQTTVCVMSARSTDLAVTLTATPATAHPGDTINYTLTAKNNGVDTAYSVNVADSFPSTPSLHAATANASQGVFTAGTGTWNVGSLANGASATLTFTATVPLMGGTLTNTATISNGASSNDPNTGNNTANAAVTVTSPAAMSATKTVSGAFTINSNVVYTIVIRNSSAYAQIDNPGHEFVDALPAGLTYVSASASSGTVSNVGNTVYWDGSVPGNNGAVTITITAAVAASAAGQVISNQGTVNFDADGNGSNESSVLTDDPKLPGASDATSFLVSSLPVPAPSLGVVQMLALILACALAGGAYLRRRRRTMWLRND